MKKIILALLMVSLLAVSLVGCTAEKEADPVEATEVAEAVEVEAVAEPVEAVTVTYWHTMSEPEAEQLDSVIAAFEEANPGVSVEATKYAYDDFKSAIITSLAGNSGPDVARMDIAWVSQFADDEALLNLSDEMSLTIAHLLFLWPLLRD